VTCQLSLRDRFGHTIQLDHANWQKHLRRHSEVEPYHDDLATVLADPHLVYEMPDGSWHFYRLGLTRGKYANCYLKVIVVEFAAEGWKIVTAYLMNEVRPVGALRWMQRPSN
jgi:hypothetical protein